MSYPEIIHIEKHMSEEDLNKRIKTLEKNTEILKRLYFVKYRYDGFTVSKASKLVGVTKRVGYIWQKRWNESGYDGLIPRYAGGRPSKLSDKQKDKLLHLLNQSDTWTTEEVRALIFKEFEVKYTPKQVRIILRSFGMKYAKPFCHDYRRPENAEDILEQRLPKINDEAIVGFIDEASPQTTANTQRLWFFREPVVYKNTERLKANAFGCYLLNGTSVIDFKEHSKKEDVSEFLRTIREMNPVKKIVLVLDNFGSHKAGLTKETAKECGIGLVYLPKYSPDLNPIEYIWKSIKKIISRNFIFDLDHIRALMRDAFIEFASRLSFAKYWIERFLGGNDWYKTFGF